MDNRPLLNIKLNAREWYARVLSNLFETPFVIGGKSFRCVEAALQGIKFEETETQEEVFGMEGKSALLAGRKITDSIIDGVPLFVYWEGEEILYNSVEHRLLLAQFIAEKVRQSPETQEALLGTEEFFLYHDPSVRGLPQAHPRVSPPKENPSTSLPERFYIEVLLSQRYLLKVCKKIAPEYSLEEKLGAAQKIGERVRKAANLQQQLWKTDEQKLDSLIPRVSDGTERSLPQEFFLAVLRVQKRLVGKLVGVAQ